MTSKDIKIGSRICIIGCGGSGKSYLSDILGTILDIDVLHLDKIFWLPGWVARDKCEFDSICEDYYLRESFIIDGNYSRTLPRRVDIADTVIWLDFSTFACILGVLTRIIKNHGRVRSDMGDGCPERYDLEFIRWVWNFRYDQRPKIADIAEKAMTDGKNVIVFKKRRQVNKFINDLQKTVAKAAQAKA